MPLACACQKQFCTCLNNQPFKALAVMRLALPYVVLQEVSAIEQVPSTADAEQHQTATHQAVVGLSNLGNTCFFNSSVQMLLACAPLQQMLLQKDHDITRGPLGFALQQATLHAAGERSCCGSYSRHVDTCSCRAVHAVEQATTSWTPACNCCRPGSSRLAHTEFWQSTWPVGLRRSSIGNMCAYVVLVRSGLN